MRARQGFAIVDEIYLGLSYEGQPRSALTLDDDIIVINSFSKYFHMTGWRLGWMIVPEAMVAPVEKIAGSLAICAPTLAQHAALACFTPDALRTFEHRRGPSATPRLPAARVRTTDLKDLQVKPDGGATSTPTSATWPATAPPSSPAAASRHRRRARPGFRPRP